jgi:hypothetical protein
MDEFVKYIITNLPNYAGFVLLAYVLWRLNNRLLDAVLSRLDALEVRVEAIAAQQTKGLRKTDH